jgi:NAD dependent epimerase/dehydratase family enzyme
MFGKAAITITHGQRVLPAKALELGHEFRYLRLTGALDDLIGRARALSDEAHLDQRLAAR